jgi:archaellum component FlaF (FlaF/FlaG flagellin family)
MDEITKREQHSSSFINEIVPDSDFSFLRRSFGSFSSTLINAATSKYQHQSKIENEILKISSIGLNLKKDWTQIKITKTDKTALEILKTKYFIDSSIIKKD